MRVLVACEESQRVAMAFRDKGHDAFSCDLKPTTGLYPEYHIVGDVRNLLNCEWDLIIAFPPCTYFSRMNFLNYYRKGVFNEKRFNKALEYVDLFMSIYNAPCNRIAIENPVPFKLFDDLLPPYNQTLQPYEFGETYSKKTCLWLKNLPPLIPNEFVLCKKYTPLITTNNSFKQFKTIEEQSTFRSKTPFGLATAMANQWG